MAGRGITADPTVFDVVQELMSWVTFLLVLLASRAASSWARFLAAFAFFPIVSCVVDVDGVNRAKVNVECEKEERSTAHFFFVIY